MPSCRQKTYYGLACPTSRKGAGARAAKKIARIVDKIPHDVWVEPFLGRGDIYRATRPVAKEILADLDCKRVRIAKSVSCAPRRSSPEKCERIKQARVSCGRDWKAYLKYDSPNTLFMLDPPWEDVEDNKMKYSKNSAISLKSVIERTKGLKGGAAIYYKDTSATRAIACRKPFKCHRIPLNIFDDKYTQLLAVKQPSGRPVRTDGDFSTLIDRIRLTID